MNRVEEVTNALLRLRVGDRVIMIDGGAHLLGIPHCVGERGVVTLINKNRSIEYVEVVFDAYTPDTLSVYEKNLVLE